jgi:hypothetical protein
MSSAKRFLLVLLAITAGSSRRALAADTVEQLQGEYGHLLSRTRPVLAIEGHQIELGQSAQSAAATFGTSIRPNGVTRIALSGVRELWITSQGDRVVELRLALEPNYPLLRGALEQTLGTDTIAPESDCGLSSCTWSRIAPGWKVTVWDKQTRVSQGNRAQVILESRSPVPR